MRNQGYTFVSIEILLSSDFGLEDRSEGLNSAPLRLDGSPSAFSMVKPWGLPPLRTDFLLEPC